MTTVSKDSLVAELKNAYSQLQAANEQSLSTFLEKVASLSDADMGGCHALVQNLQGLMPNGGCRQGYTELARKIATDNGCVDGTLPSGSIPQHNTSQHQEDAEPMLRQISDPISAGLDRQGTSVEAVEEACSAGRCSSLKQELTTVTQAPGRQDSISAIIEREAKREVLISEEYGVSLLEYVDATGDIQHPCPAWSRIPGATRVVNSLIHFDRAKALDKGWAFNIVHSRCFGSMSTIVIAFNFMFIIASTDYKISNLNQDTPQSIKAIELLFTTYYVFELVLSIFVHRRHFFFGPDFAWNWFDFIVVSQAVFEVMMEAAGQAGTKTSFLRVIRFLRISKGLRMLHAMRTFKEIKVFFDALAGSFNLFIWCSVMLALYMCMFAVFFVQGITSWLEANGEDTNVDPQVVADTKKYFGSVSECMLSLFRALSSGDDWSQYHNVLRECGWTYSLVFIAYIAFSVIAFGNVITGVYAEKAMSLAVPEMNELGQIRLDRDVGDARHLMHLLRRSIKDPEAIDKNSIDQEDFDQFLALPETVMYFAVRGLNVCSVDRFFNLLLELQQGDRVPFGVFISAVIRLNDPSSCMDVYVLNAQTKKLQKELHALLAHSLGEHHTKVSAKVDELHLSMGENHTQVSAKVDSIHTYYSRGDAPSSGCQGSGNETSWQSARPRMQGPSSL